jgi:hypothetical protein
VCLGCVPPPIHPQYILVVVVVCCFGAVLLILAAAVVVGWGVLCFGGQGPSPAEGPNLKLWREGTACIRLQNPWEHIVQPHRNLFEEEGL